MADDTLGRQLVDALREQAGGDAVVEAGGLRASAKARGAGPYGSELEHLRVERESPREDAGRSERTRRVTEGIAERVDYLGEPLELLECAPRHGRGQLRTQRDRVRDGEFFEVDVRDGDSVDVQRVRWNRESGEREQSTQNAAHGTLERLVDDLADLIDKAADDAQD